MAHGPPARKRTEDDLDNSEEDELPPPPDGGWGWVVVLASFLIHIISEYLIRIICIVYLSVNNNRMKLIG